MSAHCAAHEFIDIDDSMLIDTPKIKRLFNDGDFCSYLVKLFSLSGLHHFLDYQGAWTLTLFPHTSGGRYFTLNIGAHEVAFSTLAKMGVESCHVIILDEFSSEQKPLKEWVRSHGGCFYPAHYKNALPRSVAAHFFGTFKDAIEFLDLEQVRRAVIAYWVDSLLQLKDRDSLSSYARFHNYNAVAELCKILK